MPAKSVAQNRWAHAAAEGKIPGTPKAVGREFITDTTGLPERVHPLRKRLQQSAIARTRKES